MASLKFTYKNGKRVRKSSRKNKYKSSKTSVSQITRIVKREMSRKVEHKTSQFFASQWDIVPSNNTFFEASFFPCTPYTTYMDIDQGVGQGDRIGNRITLTNLSIKGTIWPLPYDGTTNPTPSPAQVVLYFVYRRTIPINTPTNAVNIFQNGDGSRNFQNDLTDVMAKVNNDEWRLLTKRVFKIGYAANTGTGAQPAYQAFTNNDFKLNRNFQINLTKYAVKKLRYADASSSIPRTRGIFCIPVAISSSGNPYAAADVPCRMSFTTSCRFTDA